MDYSVKLLMMIGEIKERQDEIAELVYNIDISLRIGINTETKRFAILIGESTVVEVNTVDNIITLLERLENESF